MQNAKLKNDPIEQITKVNTNLKNKIESLLDQNKSNVFKNRRYLIATNVPVKPQQKGKIAIETTSKIDFELITQKLANKIQKQATLRDELEIKECTFHPKINEITEELAQKVKNEEKIYGKIKRDYSAQKQTEEQNDNEKTGKQKRNLDPEFYERQIQWKETKLRKLENEKMAKENELAIKTSWIPKTNKNYAKDNQMETDDFNERLKNNVEVSENLKAKLEEQFYGLSFKPKINKKKVVKSRVYEKPRAKLA